MFAAASRRVLAVGGRKTIASAAALSGFTAVAYNARSSAAPSGEKFTASDILQQARFVVLPVALCEESTQNVVEIVEEIQEDSTEEPEETTAQTPADHPETKADVDNSSSSEEFSEQQEEEQTESDDEETEEETEKPVSKAAISKLANAVKDNDDYVYTPEEKQPASTVTSDATASCSPYDAQDYYISPAVPEKDTKCALCIKMREGPCPHTFRLWERCYELAKQNKEEDLVYCRCSEITNALFRCMTAHADYFETSKDRDGNVAE